MEKFELQKLRDLPIEGVAERLGLSVKSHKCLCPFHDDHHASLTFKNNKYKCWSCGESGDSISFVMKVLGKDFIDACRWLADEHNVIVTEYKPSEEKPPKAFDAKKYEKYFERPFLNEAARHFLFEERRLDPRVVRWCRLTSWRDRKGVPWLQIPYYNKEGKLIGVQNRRLKSPFKGNRPLVAERLGSDSDGGQNLEGLPRFRFPRGSQCGIYNLPVLNRLKAGDELYIAEGCSDCWSLLSAGHKAIAIPSATLLTQPLVEQLQAIAGSKVQGVQEDKNSSFLTLNSSLGTLFHMYPDNDLPGERLFLQLQKVLPNLVHHQLPLGCKDYSDYYLKVKN